MKRLLIVILFGIASQFMLAQNLETYNIPVSLIPKNFSHKDVKLEWFPKNPGIISNSEAKNYYNDADSKQIELIYGDVISAKNNAEIGVIHFLFKSIKAADSEVEKFEGDGTNRVVYLRNGKLVTTIYYDSETDKNLAGKIADYFESKLSMTRFIPERQVTVTTTAAAATSYSDTNEVTVTDAVVDSAIAVPSYKFENFHINKTAKKKQVPVKWESNPKAAKYKSDITNMIKDREPNFANFYYAVFFTVKPEQAIGFIIDSRTGIIYDTPTSCMEPETMVDFQDDSRLLITNMCSYDVKVDGSFYKGFEWIEASKTFKKISKRESYLNW
ncbi:hypothetical protein [Soonwooa sp.]|uniref:hypothetical protein n=1 Tax=Soonwooa sp. TaxID=1938592 RepID=UPI0026039A56|nr:hypothetical protein [Soonwooa sp.]